MSKSESIDLRRKVSEAFLSATPNPQPRTHVRNPFKLEQRIWHVATGHFMGSVQALSPEAYSNRHWAIVGPAATVIFHWQLGPIYTMFSPRSTETRPTETRDAAFFIGQRLFFMPKVTSLVPDKLVTPLFVGAVACYWQSKAAGNTGLEMVQTDTGESFSSLELRSGSIRVGQRATLHAPD